jgi:DNA mismatch endonuclease (patch repair protein)
MKKKPKVGRSENMRRIKSKNTSIEMKLRRVLWRMGLRYRLHCQDVFGTPDICFKNKKIAVFCDSEFWHGKLYNEGKQIPKTNREFWIKKLEANLARDREVNTKLKKEGWRVVRFWQKDIESDPEKCANTIKSLYENIG